MALTKAARDAVIAILQDQADHEWDRNDPATADRIIARLAEMGWKAPEELGQNASFSAAKRGGMTTERLTPPETGT